MVAGADPGSRLYDDRRHESEGESALGHGLRIVVFALVLGVGLYFAIVTFSSNDRIAEPAQKVALLDDVLPPPPPPEPEPQIPEVKEAAPAPEEKAPEDQPPPTDTLGVIDTGDSGTDAFAIQARQSGRDLVAIAAEGPAGTGTRNVWMMYAGTLKRDFERRLAAEAALKRNGFTVALDVWIGADGRVSRARLRSSTGHEDADQLLESVLIGVVAGSPPEDMPQPIRLRISSAKQG